MEVRAAVGIYIYINPLNQPMDELSANPPTLSPSTANMKHVRTQLFYNILSLFLALVFSYLTLKTYYKCVCTHASLLVRISSLTREREREGEGSREMHANHHY